MKILKSTWIGNSLSVSNEIKKIVAHGNSKIFNEFKLNLHMLLCICFADNKGEVWLG